MNLFHPAETEKCGPLRAVCLFPNFRRPADAGGGSPEGRFVAAVQAAHPTREGSRCLCGAVIDIKGMSQHVHVVHMEAA
jgi:hypothetical protein